MESFIKFLNTDILDPKISNLKSLFKKRITGINNTIELEIKKCLRKNGLQEYKEKLPLNFKAYVKNSRDKYNKNYFKDKNFELDYDQLFFKHQPFGTQQFADFLIFYKDENYSIYFLFFEIKSSKNNKSMWNCTLPKPFPNCIYCHFNKSNNKYTYFRGLNIIHENEYNKLMNYAQK